MSSLMSAIALRLAYGATQLPRIAWYVGHGLAMRRLAESARQWIGEVGRRHQPTNVHVPDVHRRSMGVKPTACGLGVRGPVAPRGWGPTLFIIPPPRGNHPPAQPGDTYSAVTSIAALLDHQASATKASSKSPLEMPLR
jgi:hypothetical protein